jgi:hypothetical protein
MMPNTHERRELVETLYSSIVTNSISSNIIYKCWVKERYNYVCEQRYK